MSSSVGLRAFQNARLKKSQEKAHTVTGTLAQAVILRQNGFISAAQSLCREILRKIPSQFDALHLLGVCEYQNGQHEEADRLLRRALNLDPRSVVALSNRGAVLHALQRFDEAVASYDKAIAIQPDCAEAFSNRGNALLEVERFEEAVASYDAALAIKPDFPDALSNRGSALNELRRFDEALASCDKAIALNPDHAAAFSNRGNALLELKRFDEALVSYDRAIAINPNLAAAWLGRGNIFLYANRLTDAFVAHSKALAIKPNYFKALMQLACWYERQGDTEGVMSIYDRVLAIKPDFADAISNRIFALDFAPNVGVEEQQEARKYWWRQVGSKIAAKSQLRHSNTLDPTRRIVVGYVSSDFREHSASLTFAPVLRRHDKTRFEVICYSCSATQDDITREFQRIAQWRDATQLSDHDLIELIQADKVDILIDLSGHTGGHRLGVFARKPAPLQVTAWGNATGTGLPTIDYLFSDPVAVPNSVRHLFAERIYDLPCLLTMEAPAYQLQLSDPPVVSKGHITFGFFNRISKISDDALRAWAQILRSAPRSQLLLKAHALEDDSVRLLLTERFAKHEISADRLDFIGATSREEHLIAFNKVDICLDPFPQNGGVSTWEPLYMGVPVVAKLGHTVPSRVGGAILTSVGLSEWVADSVDDYAAIALKYAAQPDYLKKLRHELPTKISTSAAGNAAQYTRAVEEAYSTMWEDYCKRQT